MRAVGDGIQVLDNLMCGQESGNDLGCDFL